MDNSRDTNLLANIISIVLNLFLGVVLVRRYRNSHSESFRSAFLLVAPALLMSMVGALLFLILYVMRVAHVIDDYLLQSLARLIVLFFYFFIPASIYFSLQQLHG